MRGSMLVCIVCENVFMLGGTAISSPPRGAYLWSSSKDSDAALISATSNYMFSAYTFIHDINVIIITSFLGLIASFSVSSYVKKWLD